VIKSIYSQAVHSESTQELKKNLYLTAILVLFSLTTQYSQSSNVVTESANSKDSIYIAFFCDYFPRMTHLHLGYDSSVVSWLKHNWDDLHSCSSKILSGSSNCDSTKYCLPWSIENQISFPDSLGEFPQTIKELLSINSSEGEIRHGPHAKGNEHIIEVVTGDDEVSIVWMVFDEHYKSNHFDKIAMWFNSEMPTDFGEEGRIINVPDTYPISGQSKGATYLLKYQNEYEYYSSGEVIKIDGIRLPELGEFLMKPVTQPNKYYRLSSIYDFMKNSSNKNLYDVLMEMSNELDSSYGKPSKLISNESEHMFEVIAEFPDDPNKNKYSTSSYARWLVFDDLWIEKNYDLAKSIIGMRLNGSVMNDYR